MNNLVVEVVYALPDKQYVRRVTLSQGDTVQDAILASGLLDLRPEIDVNKNKIGVYGRAVTLTDRINSGDRVEIYRPLIADPKALRRQRAAQKEIK